ncbi:MAG: hypothetical protein ACLUSP_04825 [Christensenellales bacterium]
MLTPKITPTKTVMIILAFQPIFFATALPAFTATESEEPPDEEERANVVLPDEELFCSSIFTRTFRAGFRAAAR